MDSKQHIWQRWVQNLHRWGVGEVAAVVLEASSPLNLILAQGLYLVQPFFSSLEIHKHLAALADVLEEPEETHRFVIYLREGSLS